MLHELVSITAGMRTPRKDPVDVVHPLTGEVTQKSYGGIAGGSCTVNWVHSSYIFANLTGDLKAKFKPPAKKNKSIQVLKADLVKAVDSLVKKPIDTLIDIEIPVLA